MSDRLADLRRQRALLQEHLAWLDREIAAAGGNATGPTSPAPTSSGAAPSLSPPAPVAIVVSAALKASAGAATPGTSAGAPESPIVAAAADAILDEYRVPPEVVRTDVRKGCFLYFAVALALVALTVVGLYFALRKN